jgi:hypothetical protein
MSKPFIDNPSSEVLEYLDDLRIKGETNMYGAGPWIEEEFGVDRITARHWLAFWMDTFTKRHAGDSE